MADKQSIEQFKKDVLEQLSVDSKSFVEASSNLTKYATEVNSFFTQGRQRITELSTAIADASPNIVRLGGDMGDVSSIMGDIAEASRRNVIASSEDVEKMFAATKVLGLQASELSEAFLNIGAGIETIPETLEESVQYIQSIGGNAKSVMKDVTDNMGQMNRFQFEGGVLGLTKMAAQASMLRFDMSETFRLADKVLSPEGAIEVASAFQRLGVASGTLVDPFALMNASINDPSGLQDSLAEVSKQFTYFDEETKTFKINPQGVLTLKEMEGQAGLAQGSLSKMGLAAAELDKRISAVGDAGLNIKEDDKQYLANIAKMGEGGEYEIKLRNDEGKEETRKLSQVTQDEFEKLIKEQRDGPKTMEDMARSQLSTSQLVLADVTAIREKIVGGVVSGGQVLKLKEDVREGITTVSGGLSKMGTTKDVRMEAETAATNLVKFVKDSTSSGGNFTDALSDYLTKSGDQLGNMSEKFEKSLTQTVNDIQNNLKSDNAVVLLTNQLKETIQTNISASKPIDGKTSVSSFLDGKQSQVQQASSAASTSQVQVSKGEVDVSGVIKVEFSSPNGSELTTKMLDDWAASDKTKKFLASVFMEQQKEITKKRN